jgi:hypothetical protein
MEQAAPTPHWNLAKRIAFRFSFVYLGLFVVYFAPIWLQYLLFRKRESPLVLGGISGRSGRSGFRAPGRLLFTSKKRRFWR